eukprot:576315_1
MESKRNYADADERTENLVAEKRLSGSFRGHFIPRQRVSQAPGRPNRQNRVVNNARHLGHSDAQDVLKESNDCVEKAETDHKFVARKRRRQRTPRLPQQPIDRQQTGVAR